MFGRDPPRLGRMYAGRASNYRYVSTESNTGRIQQSRREVVAKTGGSALAPQRFAVPGIVGAVEPEA
jgi:hypothetical protein